MRHQKSILLGIAILILLGTSDPLASLGAITTNMNIFVRPNFRDIKGDKYVILPVEMKAAWLQKADSASKKTMLENRNYEKLELALLNTGATVLERQKIDRILKEQGFSQTGLTEENAMAIGKLLNAHFVVFCTVIDFGVIGKSAVTEIAIKAININDGSIVWKAYLSGKIIDTTDDFSNSAMESQVYDEFTKKLIEKMKR